MATTGKAQIELLVAVVVLVMLGVEARPPVRRAGGAFGLEEVISGDLRSAGFSGTWISGTQFLYTDMLNGNVMRYDATTQTTSILVERPVLEEYRATSYELSADGLFLLIGYDQQSGYRHSTSSRFVIYDLSYRTYAPVAGGELLQLVRLAPVGNALAFVFNNDLYYRTAGYSGAEERRLTFSGVPGVIYNGVPDWVYEEEVLGSGSALWFSPNGASLAFASFNDTEVRTASYVHYGEPGSLDSQYSSTVSIRYPKPGTANPRVGLYVADLTLAGARLVEMPAPVDVVSSEHILYGAVWANDYEVSAVWTNRVQNLGQLQVCVAATGVCQPTYQMSESSGWLDVVLPTFDATGARVVSVLPQPQGGGAGNYAQVTLFTRKVSLRDTMATGTALSWGRSVVTYIYGWDKINDIIYYQSTAEDLPAQRHVYSVPADGSTGPTCLSCNVLTTDGNACRYAFASFSLDMSHMALTCAGPDIPHVSIYRSGSDSALALWEDNRELRSKIGGRQLPKIVDTEVPVAGGFTAKVRLYLPPGAETSGLKYPMLVYVYGGPNSAQITDAFTVGWGAYLTTNRSIIYAMIDGRGSGMKGDDIKFSIYRRLGTVEVIDQINVTKMLQDTYPYIDSQNTAIWGWSYGGYATAMSLARDTGGVFKCGASVAPVTSWIYYDSIYTERYMGQPRSDDNLYGYNDGDVTRLVEGFRHKQFYLLHGNADDNVHYLQAMVLSKALERATILFRQQSYPDENHNLGSVLLHVYGSMDQFWTQCFNS
ncbi:venom dipeptidyl peptidase 4-like [Periplaneta americana]|uniref:venom dipeptidyl peptidase 4-like n=1 Tax=Periplaneta americana TaxID=6978 RepID=UPI0037E95D8C